MRIFRILSIFLSGSEIPNLVMVHDLAKFEVYDLAEELTSNPYPFCSQHIHSLLCLRFGTIKPHLIDDPMIEALISQAIRG